MALGVRRFAFLLSSPVFYFSLPIDSLVKWEQAPNDLDDPHTFNFGLDNGEVPNPESKWGEAVGNIVLEWVQMASLVFLTKRLAEIRSKESR